MYHLVYGQRKLPKSSALPCLWSKNIAKELCSNYLWPKIGQFLPEAVLPKAVLPKLVFAKVILPKYVYKSSLVLEKYIIQV